MSYLMNKAIERLVPECEVQIKNDKGLYFNYDDVTDAKSGIRY